MGAAPVYLGDEVSAAGWRLAGVDAQAPRPGAEAAAFEAALARAPLVLISAAVAAALPPARLRRAQAAMAPPLLLVVADRSGAVALPDLAGRLRAQLGIA